MEIETDASYTLITGSSNPHKRALYNPEGKERCKQYICRQKKTITVAFFFVILISTIAVLISLLIVDRKPCVDTKKEIQENSIQKQDYVSKNGKPFPWKDIRLPKFVVPISYDINMHPNLTTFTYSGEVDIVIEASKTVDFIVFHCKSPTKIVSYILWKVNSEEPVQILELLEYETNEQIYMKLDSSLEVGQKYKLSLKFTGELLDSLSGFYRSSYHNKAGEKVWLATTQFESTDARAAFPCFDEPQLKAVFSMKMVRDPNQISLFNTALDKTVTLTDGLVEDQFGSSVKMSTYLVAFVVCDFKSLTNTTKNGIKVSVYAPKELIDLTEYALQVAVSVLDYYETFFGIPFPMPKLDLIAIPDFNAGAMENWGLITYRMTAITYDPQESSAASKQWVAVVIAHELAHQWFGNLVTMEWWNDLWLNEGFASFMEYLGTNHKEPEWKMLDQFISNELVRTMHADSLSSSHPISIPSTSSDPAEIAELFDEISYGKGSSVLRMLESVIGRSVLQTGLQQYLTKYKYDNAVTDDLWESLTEAAKGQNPNINVKEIMDTWTLQMGYPLVTVTRNGNQVTAKQERFLLNPHGIASTEFSSDFGYKWHIPLTYTTYSEESKTVTKHQTEWMHMDSTSFTLSTPLKWIKFNTDMNGFYRILYTEEDLQALIDQLHEDHTVFSAADRASLIDDTFALAQAGHIDIVKALEMSKYLMKEDNFVPWEVAIGQLQHIGSLLEEKPSYQYYAKYVTSLITNMLQKLSLDTSETHLQKYLQSILVHLGVTLNVKETVTTAKKMYSNWMKDGIKLPVDLKKSIYKAGIQYGGDEEWQFAWESFVKSSLPSEKRELLQALATTRDSLQLNRYLQMSLDTKQIQKGDTALVIANIANNPAGKILAWDFFKQNWQEFKKRYDLEAFEMGNLIVTTASQFTSQYSYEEVKDFFEKHTTRSGKRAVSKALESIAINMEWIKNNEKICVDWFENETKGNS